MENNFLKQAKQTMQRLTNTNKQAKKGHQTEENLDANSIKSVQQSIQSAYEQSSPEEQEEIKQFEQKITQNKLK